LSRWLNHDPRKNVADLALNFELRVLSIGKSTFDGNFARGFSIQGPRRDSDDICHDTLIWIMQLWAVLAIFAVHSSEYLRKTHENNRFPFSTIGEVEKQYGLGELLSKILSPSLIIWGFFQGFFGPVVDNKTPCFLAYSGSA
jgi:hypothetical protein